MSAVAAAYAAVWLLTVWRAADVAAPSDARVEVLAVTTATAPGDPTPIVLDAALRVPSDVTADRPAPAVVLLHGFASDRRSQDARAEALVRRGYVVLTPSARGFGASEGTISLADRDREGRDLSALIDVLASRDEVLTDASGNPRVALVGTSYGGGLALLGGVLDTRVDAVVAVTAWHDLAAALAPNAVGDPASGPLHIGWTSLLFTARTLPGVPTDIIPGDDVGPAMPEGTPSAPVTLDRCGRFAEDVCALADRAAVDGVLDADARAVLARASLAAVPARDVPTLLVQGRDDTLFGADAAFANAAALHAAGAPVRLRFVAGGHAAAGAAAASGPVAEEIDAWLARWLRDEPSPEAADGVLVHDAAGTLRTLAWPGEVRDAASRTFTPILDGTTQLGTLLDDGRSAQPERQVATVFTPAGGLPAALTSVPGIGPIGQLAGLAGLGSVVDVPGQHVAFTSRPFADELLLVGPATLTLDVAAETGQVQLFVRLSSVAPGGLTTIIGSSFAPVRLDTVSRDVTVPTRVGITLPDMVHLLEPGERLRLTIATTDQAYANLREPGTVRLDVAAAQLTVRGPGIGAAHDANAAAPRRSVWAGTPSEAVAVGAVGAAVLGGGTALLVGRIRRSRRAPLAPHAERLARAASGPPPIVVRGLVKEYADGTRAVDGLDLTVHAGQVVGLLGPNGAGKTTTLRMLLGLITPTGGSVEVFGEQMRPGHPVLERVGALVEGPGLIPDLSGRDNLALFWRSGGRDLADADLPWAMGVADLGPAIDRPVRTYSHGMAQRLAIAQALLGRPELLILDEPTDGLDPEQIRAMRRLLVRLGAEGHTVLVSSHLLAEVEQTCTHAVVVSHGRVLAAGPVAELGARGRTLVVEVDDRERARVVLGSQPGVLDIAREGAGLVVTLDEPARSADVLAVLIGAGLRVTTASRRGRLEDAFLQLTGARPSGADRADTGEPDMTDAR